MIKVQICISNGLERTKYFDVILNNNQPSSVAIDIVKANASKLGLSSLAYIGRGNNKPELLDQFCKLKPGTILDGDWFSYNYGCILINGGKR